MSGIQPVGGAGMQMAVSAGGMLAGAGQVDFSAALSGDAAGLLSAGGAMSQHVSLLASSTSQSNPVETFAALALALLLSKDDKEQDSATKLLLALAALAAFNQQSESFSLSFQQEASFVGSPAQAYAGGAAGDALGGAIDMQG